MILYLKSSTSITDHLDATTISYLTNGSFLLEK